MKNTKLLCLFLFNIFYGFAQVKEFIVDDNIKNVTNQVSEFQNQIMDGIKTASQSDKTFETDIIIKNEEYNSDSGDNYLKIKTNKALKVTSHWNILLNKFNGKQTKVSIKLVKAESGKTVLKLDEIASKGKLEQNLYDYIKDNIEKKAITQSEAKIKSLGNGYKLLEKDNYAVQFPAKWEMKCPGPHLESFYIWGPKEEEFVYINLIKENDEEALENGFSQYVEYEVRELSNIWIKVIKEEKIDDETYRVEDCTLQGDRLRSIRYFYLIDNEVYLLTFCADYEIFNQYLKEATKIMNTLKINNKAIKI